MVRISNFFSHQKVSAAPLAVFRICFGAMMLFSIIRFAAYGWIQKLYIDPNFHFKFFGFSWVKDWGSGTYLLFVLCGISALFVALGWFYRIAIVLFFLSFTYIELIDKTTYLNHYYFVSVLSFLMCWLPAANYFSIDAYRKGSGSSKVTKWCIDSIKVFIAIVYVYAGLAKLNSDWLLKATPLNIWLPSKYHIPFIGESLLTHEWVFYVMSWGGMFYDLCIPFLLLCKRTRVVGFILVVLFHVLTKILFPIGMFPYIMIVSALVFFDSQVHEKILRLLNRLLPRLPQKLYNIQKEIPPVYYQGTKTVVVLVLVLQLLLPWRYLLYPGELFWTEEGYRFSWRVMLKETAGYANFKIVDGNTGRHFYVDNADFLTAFQEKQMSFQPDFILEYAHYLGDHFSAQGHKNVEVYVDCFVALNGRLSSRFIDPNTDLYQQKESFKHKNWIIPFNDEIKGL